MNGALANSNIQQQQQQQQQEQPVRQHNDFLGAVANVVRQKKYEIFVSWYDGKGNLSDSRTFGQVWETAGRIAYCLRQEWKLAKGDRVVLCYDFGLHFFEAFFGCLRAGVVAVLVYPPAPPLQKSLTKLAKTIEDCNPALVLTDTKIVRFRMLDKSNPFSKSSNLWPTQVEFKATDSLPRKLEKVSFDEANEPADVAFLQYTSGSTGDPKGVVITFEVLKANVDLTHYNYLQCYRECGGVPDEIIAFSWLPQYHDMGLLIGAVAPLAAGWRMHMMSPITFIQDPLLWMKLISKHKIHWSIAPDFAFNLISRRMEGASNVKLDLSTVKFLTSAAEPCRLETAQRFSQALAPYGLCENWYSSAYGLAEHVCGVAYLHGLQLSTPGKEDDAKTYISCAKMTKLCPELILKIVNPENGDEVADDEPGELWISGPSVAAGYFGKPDLSDQTFKATLASCPGNSFLRTGDLAFVQKDYLYICGRIKDLIIQNGVNYYPQDIEFVVQEASTAVRPGCVAAFSSSDSGTGANENLEIVFEIRKANYQNAAEVIHNVRKAVTEKIGLLPRRIVAIEERTINKTTSGKIQRKATRISLHEGTLTVVLDWSPESNTTVQEAPASFRISSVAEAKSVAFAPDIHDFDSDVLVIGAGVVGLCFARDISSLGYRVTIAEKSSEIGGVWATNDYPGLRLHHAGHCYRCLSHAPSWTKEHVAEEMYRPCRSEIFKYCKELADRKNISVMLGAVANYDEREDIPGGVAVKVNNELHRTRFLFVSIGAGLNYTGSPVMPVSCQRSQDSSNRPLCFHSSQLNIDRFSQVQQRNGRIVVVGSSKSAIDILQAFQCDDERVVWAHRGHTAFLNRNTYQNDAETLSKASIQARDNPNETHWSRIAYESGLLISCQGSLTQRRVPFLFGICSQEELSHADKFHQYYLKSIETRDDNSLCLMPGGEADDTLVLCKKDCIVFCTGQRNDSWKPPTFTSTSAEAGLFSICVPLGALIPLRLSLFHLHKEQEKLNFFCEELNRAIQEASSGNKFSDLRELELAVASDLKHFAQNILFKSLKGDVAFRPEWLGTWHGRDVGVHDAFKILGADSTVKGSVNAASKPRVSFSADHKSTENGFHDLFESILSEFFGSFDEDKTWEEMGMTSLISVEFQLRIADEFHVNLPPNYQIEYCTPKQLSLFIEQSKRSALPIDLPELARATGMKLLPSVTAAVQGFLILSTMFLVALTFVPVYHLGQLIYSVPQLSLSVGSTQWQWLPFVVPCWMLTCSFTVIALKWLVIGRYLAKEISVNSIAYVRWWYIDRVMTIWQWWIGDLILNTPLTWLFYTLMGAKIHWTVAIDAPLREFDLIEIHAHATIKTAVRCRQFSAWEEDSEGGLKMRFRPVKVGQHSRISGHLSPGAAVGANSLVCRMTMLAEGAQVPDSVVVTGVPAAIEEKIDSSFVGENVSATRVCAMGILKLVWLLFELYVFFAFLFIGQLILNSNLPSSWRYTPLLYWYLQVVLSSILSMAFCVPLKWAVIGRKRPGKSSNTFLSELFDWGVDFHFQSSIRVNFLLESSKMGHVYLRALGLNIEESQIFPQLCPPSKVDLLTIKRSFVSIGVLEPKQDGETLPITIEDSQLGHSVVVDGGVTIKNAQITPMTRVRSSYIGKEDFKAEEMNCRVTWYNDVVVTITWAALFFSLIPAFEAFKYTNLSLREGNGVLGFPVVSLALALLVQNLTWFTLFLLWSRAMIVSDGKGGRRPVSFTLFGVHMSLAYYLLYRWSFLQLAGGTFWMNQYLRLLGCTVEGGLLYFGTSAYEFTLMTFRDKTVIDNAVAIAHAYVGNTLVFGPSVYSGVVHPGSLVLANTDMTGCAPETFPLHFVSPTEAIEQSLSYYCSANLFSTPFDIADENESIGSEIDESRAPFDLEQGHSHGGTT